MTSPRKSQSTLRRVEELAQEFRCQANTNNAEQCRRHFRLGQYCWQHAAAKAKRGKGK